MKAIWNSIRSAVTLIIVLTLCVFLLWFTRIGLLDAKEALRVIELLGMLVLGYYFMKKRNGEEPKPPPITGPPDMREPTKLPPPLKRVK